MSIFLRAANISRQYRRDGYDILTYFGDLGGLFEITYFFGKVLTSIFAGKLFLAAMVSSAYKI